MSSLSQRVTGWPSLASKVDRALSVIPISNFHVSKFDPDFGLGGQGLECAIASHWLWTINQSYRR